MESIKNDLSNRNKKVSSRRSKEWRNKLVLGKLDAQKNPSKLRENRVKKLIPQETIASKTGLSLAYYGMIERGTRLATLEMAQKISKTMGGDVKNYFKKFGEKFVVIK